MAILPDQVTRNVLDEVFAERHRQYLAIKRKDLWDCADPSTPHPNQILVLTEELGEVSNCILEAGFGAMTHDEFKGRLYEELIQVAAVATACAESLCR